MTLIQAATKHRRFAVASTVARAAWQSPTIHEDLGWNRELAQAGEQAAIAARQPELLIELLNNSAETYASAADWPGAERAWLRALAIAEDLDDTALRIHFLRLLATNYLNWHRPHKAVDMQIKIVRIHERANDPIETAEAQVAAAHTMNDAGRLDAAIEYLGRADHVLSEHPDLTSEVTSLHAAILNDLGQIHARVGKINTARTCYRRALAMVVDTDEKTANQIRASQAALPTNVRPRGSGRSAMVSSSRKV